MKKISICITYFYQRNNIEFFLNELKKIDKLNLIEILIRNDNPKIKLSFGNKFKDLNLKIFNEKKKSMGEIYSLQFLVNKAKNDYATLVADDDFISHKYFDKIFDMEKNHDFYLCPMAIEFCDVDKALRLKNDINNLCNLFFSKKINISGTVGLTFKVDKFKNLTNFKLLKKYHFDLYIISIVSRFENYKIFNKIYSFNNRKSSKISSGKISLNLFKKDTENFISTLSKNLVVLSKYYFALDYISILFRDKNNIRKIDKYFIKFLINEFNLIQKINILFKYLFFYFIKKIKLIF
jgi:hypothetical protein